MEGARRGVTLAEQLAASSNLRDLLKLRDDDDDNGQIAAARRRRTLLDVIRAADADPAPAAAAGPVPAAVSPGGAARAQGERVSLMALLERTEQQWATACAGDGQWKELVVDRDEGAEEERKGVGGACCVCVARGKGAAFIPCGHTFCRSCARELRAARGRCPLCNAAIREVLNLF